MNIAAERQIDTLPPISILPSEEEYAQARRQSWVATSDRGFEVLTHDNGWAIMSSKEFDIGGGFGAILDLVGVTEGPYREEWNKQIVCHDDDMRDPMRVPFAKLLRPQSVAKLQGLVRDLINGILDDIEDPSNVDFMEQIGNRLPTQLYCSLVSVPLEMAPEILRITEAINPPILTLDRDRMPASEAAYWEGKALLKEHIEARRANLGDDFTSELLRLEEEGLIEPGNTITFAMSLLIASMDNTMHQLGLTFGTLLEDRTRWEQVLARPTAATQAAEETFRLRPRFNVIARHTARPVTIDDFTFPENSWIWISTRSGGRDESKFENADQFQLGRPATRALQFGAANYSCLGATLARLEVSETIRIIAERFPNVRMLGSWKPSIGPMVSECENLKISLV